VESAREIGSVVGVIRALVTGYGYWGRVLVRNLVEHPDFFVAGIHDPNGVIVADAMRQENLNAFDDLDEAIRETLPDVVIVTSPIGTMIDAARLSLSHGVHVMIAKPGATTRQEADELIAAADTAGVTVTTDYTMLMSPRIAELRDQIRALGGLYDAHLMRECIGSRSSAPILLDMMVHDLAIICMFTEEWQVASVALNDDDGFVYLESGVVRALLSAKRNTSADTRLASFECEYGYAYWDQIRDKTAKNLVYDRLTNLAETIRGDDSPDYQLMRRVSALLEDVALCA
jgi:predicted dehydrogenase